MSGGDAFVFTDLPKGAGNPKWSPDGKSILFTASANPDDLAKQARLKKKEEESKKTAQADGIARAERNEEPKRKSAKAMCMSSPALFIVMTTEGYLDPKRPSHLWIVSAPRSGDEKVQPRQLTSGRFDEGNAFWSKDGAQIYFASWHVDEPYYELPKTELYVIPAKGGDAKLLTTIPMGIGNLAPSPDGKRAAFIAAAQ